MDLLLINIGLAISGLSVGFAIGYKIGHSVGLPKLITTVKRDCDVWFKNNPKSWSSVELHMQNNKVITNGCHSLNGTTCKYTNERCQLL